MRYRRLITIGAVVAACGALGAAPALASQPSAAHPAPLAATHPGHAVVVPHIASGPGCNVQNCELEDAGDVAVAHNNTIIQFRTPVLGVVHQCWPFSNCRFDTLYSGHEVLQFIAQNVSRECLQTDSVHSGVGLDLCGSHNAGTYWVTVGNGGSRGVCVHAFWLVNVGITNRYDPYPYGSAMFFNSNDHFYVQSHRPISNDDQWCTYPYSG